MTYRNQGTWTALVVGMLLGLTACESPIVSPDDGPDLSAATLGADGSGAVATPFQASFFTDGQGLAPEPACGVAPPNFLNTQVGEGRATHLGGFSVRITFCMDMTDALDDGDLTGDDSLPYHSGMGTLVAANGDELYFTIAGEVLLSDHPDFDLEFRDEFQFTGGTGRFEGASGSGLTESFVDRAAGRTHHDWRATLVLHPGR